MVSLLSLPAFAWGWLVSGFTPLYTIIVPDSKTDGIRIYYMYRTKLSTREQIERLHTQSLKIIMQGIKNPDKKISELMDNVN